MTVAVIDGRGSSLNNCIDTPDEVLPCEFRGLSEEEKAGLWEKESVYSYSNGELLPVFKDFSPLRRTLIDVEHPILPRSLGHGIGAMYGAVSRYVFGKNFSDGKLMGLAPYGNSDSHDFPLFDLRDGRVFNRYDWIDRFPAEMRGTGTNLKQNFETYANLALHVQTECERAILYILESYRRGTGIGKLGYAGGVALNAVCNGKIISGTGYEDLYIQPAAGDNGIAIGCAYYGWLKTLGNDRVPHDGTTWFASEYGDAVIEKTLSKFSDEIIWTGPHDIEGRAQLAAQSISEGQVLGWFQGKSEFGPRALGHRSIIADPRRGDMRDHINANVKFREDFRPFAPSVLATYAAEYFEGVTVSPYMIQVAQVPEALQSAIPAVVHQDGSARLQTVTEDINPRYAKLLAEMKSLTGLPMVINTSLNRRGMPIVETPDEAVRLLLETGLDALVLEGYIVRSR
ncbi:carbamoyltransferase C-terminal domain-containing protein [Streptomyces sp. NPDC006552]|uniref:carbamoyltransferase C-terminal domain-containing protein n=1 Tax=Streptomyces sp. NPDC006552 TaxID=3157179 RepID=UPI0033AF4EB7